MWRSGRIKYTVGGESTKNGGQTPKVGAQGGGSTGHIMGGWSVKWGSGKGGKHRETRKDVSEGEGRLQFRGAVDARGE